MSDRGTQKTPPGGGHTFGVIVAVLVVLTILTFPVGSRPERVDFAALTAAAEAGDLARIELASHSLEIRAWLHPGSAERFASLFVDNAVGQPTNEAEAQSLAERERADTAERINHFDPSRPVIAAAPTSTSLDQFVEAVRSAQPGPSVEAMTPIVVSPPARAWVVALIQTIPWILIAGLIGFTLWRTRRPGAGNAKPLREIRDVTTRFSDVAGAEEAKEEVAEVVEFLRDSSRFRQLGGRIPRGVLLVGAPGTGKTLLARAVAGEAGGSFFSISGSDFVEMFVGVGAARVRDLFRTARQHAPAIIFLDEIDAVGRRRSHAAMGGSEEREQTLNAILVEMDGFDSSDDVIVIAATNRPDVLDPALLRPGRFDREIRVDLPDRTGREQILGVHCRNVPLAESVDLSAVARGTPGFSGAELAAIVNEAALRAALESRTEVEDRDFEEARDKVRWGRASKSRLINEEDRRITAYHEAGHAILAHLLPEVEPLHKVTIVPRGPSLGSTMQLPDSDPAHFSRECAFGRLVVLLGGRIAESRFGGSVSSGAVNDLERVSDLARRMVCEWGMSDSVGLMAYSMSDAETGESSRGVSALSEKAKERIDNAIRELVESAQAEAQRIIEQYGNAIERITEALLEDETLHRAQVADLVGRVDGESTDTAWSRSRSAAVVPSVQSGT